jgi:hypothetical protein
MHAPFRRTAHPRTLAPLARISDPWCVRRSRHLRRSVQWAPLYDSFSTWDTNRADVVLKWNSDRDGLPPKCEPLATMTPLTSGGYPSVIADASAFIEKALEDVDFDFEAEVADFRVYAEYEPGAWPFCPDEPVVRVYVLFTATATDAALPLPPGGIYAGTVFACLGASMQAPYSRA